MLLNESAEKSNSKQITVVNVSKNLNQKHILVLQSLSFFLKK